MNEYKGLRRAACALLLITFVVTACGSTVSFQQATANGTNDGGLGVTAARPGSTQATTANGIPGQAGNSGGTNLPGSGAAPPPQTSAGIAVRAPGVTASKIYIGATYTKNQDEAYAAIGASSAGSGDARETYNVVIKDLNQHGGIAGRQIVPIYYGLDATSTDTADHQYQAACDAWTSDHKVFAILAYGPVIQECSKKAGAVALSAYPGGSTDETYRRYPHYVELASINLVRMGPVTINGLAQINYFDKGARIGIMTWDHPSYHRSVERGYLPSLKARGLRLATEPAYVHVPQSLADLGATSADIQSVVLRFSSQQITHVFLVDGSAGLCGIGCMTLLFLRGAQSQHYNPKYGFNDNNDPIGGLDQGLYPPDQLSRSVAVTWNDTDKRYDAGWHINGARERCYALMRKHGIDLSDPTVATNALYACDELWFMKASVEKMNGSPLSADNFLGGVNALGHGFQDPTVYATHFGPEQHDGLAAVRNARFDDRCNCYRYLTTPYRII